MSRGQDRTTRYKEGSLTLTGTVMLGTGVMIGAGIFALTGQMAQMTGVFFPLAFLAAAVIVSFSSYSYVKISNAWRLCLGQTEYRSVCHWRGGCHDDRDRGIRTAFPEKGGSSRRNRSRGFACSRSPVIRIQHGGQYHDGRKHVWQYHVGRALAVDAGDCHRSRHPGLAYLPAHGLSGLDGHSDTDTHCQSRSALFHRVRGLAGRQSGKP